MILCLDVGNSQIHAGVFEFINTNNTSNTNNTPLLSQFRCTTVQTQASSDELGTFFKQVLREQNIQPECITRVAISSVVPSLDYSLRSAFIKYFNIEPYILKNNNIPLIHFKHPSPHTIGADILAASIASASIFPKKRRIIIDLGTATVIHPLCEQNIFTGANIMPGINTAMKSLSNNTAKLTEVAIEKMHKATQAVTQKCIQSGLYFGHLGAMKEIIQRTAQQKNWTCDDYVTIATGGFTHLFADEKIFDIIIPELVLKGIKIAAEA